MVQKNLSIFLALLWIMPPLIARRSIMPKFQKTSKISYRQEDDKVNSSYSRDTGMQYRHEKKEDTAGFIPKLIARPEYGTVYPHQGMLLQSLLIYSHTITLFERSRSEIS